MNFKNSNYCICKERSYTFSYDAGNRLTAANYAGLNNENYSLSNMGYDSNGNILSLTRNGKNGNSFSIIDNLTYSYTGNQLTNITDAISGNEDVGDLRDAGTSTDYTYYANGSLKSDANKGISNIVYDTYLNKISQVQFTNGKTMRFFYDASGQLLKRTFTGGDTWSYSGDAVYKNGVFYQTAIPEGRIVNNNGNLEKQFYYQDHLGSNRVVYRSNNGKLEVVQRNDYDIWGWELNNSIVGNPKEYRQFQNHEKMDELGWINFGARMYDPTIGGRFLSVDEKAFKFPSLSPFAGMGNNPLKYIDPDGKEIVNLQGRRAVYIDKKGVPQFTKYATEDIKRGVSALMLTSSGTSQLRKMTESETKVKYIISPETKIINDGDGNQKIIYGETLQGNKDSKSNYGKVENSNGTLGLKESTITIYEGSIKVAIKEGSGTKLEGLGLEQAIGAVTAHESVHGTDKSEINKDLKAQNEGLSNPESEKKPNEVEQKVINELKNPK